MTHRMWWNVIDKANPDKLLMSISTMNYVVASNRASELRMQYPEKEFDVVKTAILEPYKKEVGL